MYVLERTFCSIPRLWIWFFLSWRAQISVAFPSFPLAAQECPLLQLPASHSAAEQLFLWEMANPFNSSRFSPLAAARCWPVTVCRHCCIRKHTQLHQHGGTPPWLCSGSCGFPWVGCAVLPGDMQNHGIAGCREDGCTDLERSVWVVAMAPVDSRVCNLLMWYGMGKRVLWEHRA